jgi:hypothetical protein
MGDDDDPVVDGIVDIGQSPSPQWAETLIIIADFHDRKVELTPSAKQEIPTSRKYTGAGRLRQGTKSPGYTIENVTVSL